MNAEQVTEEMKRRADLFFRRHITGWPKMLVCATT